MNLYQLKTYMSRYRVNPLLIVLNLYSASINKTLVTESITMKVTHIIKFDLKYVNTVKPAT